ncbi:MAG: SIS domain-containing protein [Actinomycetes bacterium]
MSPAGDVNVLDNVGGIEAADASGMLRAVATSGAQVREGLSAAVDAGVQRLADGGRPRAMVVTGMGGSGIAGDVLMAVAGVTCAVPVTVHRGFGLPGWVGAADVVAAVSCSGTTEETLSAAEEAARRGARLVAVGAVDSPLAEIAAQARAPYVAVAQGRQPRAALWSLAVPVLVAARAAGVTDVTDGDLSAAADVLDTVSQSCRPGSETFVNPAKSLAVDLSESLPMVWGSTQLAGVAAYRFVCQLAENAKYPAVSGVFPEAGHNQIVTFDGVFAHGEGSQDDFFRDRVDEPMGSRRLRLVILRDADEPPLLRARREAAAELAGERGVPVSEIAAEGDGPVTRLASLVGPADFATVYLALLFGIDPTPVGPIVELKSRLRR